MMERELEVYRKKLSGYYNSAGELVQYPSKRPMRIFALIEIARKFDLEKRYTEKEVNEIIRESIAFGDIELVRREMFQYKLIGRLRDGSQYWAEPDWESKYEEYL